ncbi:uncharacterized protein THITE_2110472 [Thermothielavioides terrestris NRRL 8126]|uniref:Uncharacterized protein n=1 Tax=Thermothielavioides terrestris (strain ATCC 38088 / NRRL 8126) TaxID=578455 RepID=G2QT45_THETT|nr:uncharacterized protein THITE_2110472 [Thermothielavioides terrestris NRRL 8126]AEO64371.1 hypothetical protein THITE_2110472 [Thermothielavioides terrestris NRRL 8126]
MPDLNSVPPSPHYLANASRQPSSQQMPPPPAPRSPSLHILPSNQGTVNASAASSTLPSPRVPSASSFPSLPALPMGDNTGVGPGPGPLRHPRPLTAADLHLQLEKEQEAVVNRLTRELSILRAAQNASVVSNASSASASTSAAEPAAWADASHSSLGTSHYQPVRHHRTSSSASARSFTANAGSVSTASLAGISSPVPVRPAAQPAMAIPIGGGTALSRQNSSASRRSRAGSPSPASHSLSGSYTQQHHHHHHHNRMGGEPSSLPSGYFTARPPAPAPPVRSHSGSNTATTPASTAAPSELSPGILPATSRFEETALRRAELEEIKRENEALRRRVRELERLVQDAAAAKRTEEGSTDEQQHQQHYHHHHQDDDHHGAWASRPSEEGRLRAVSASALSSAGSVTVGLGVGGGGGDVPEGEEGDEVVRVGESAASAGLGRGRGRVRE